MRVVGNLLLDPFLIQFIRRERADSGSDRRGRNGTCVVGQRAHMQNLQADFAVRRCAVDSVSDNAMTSGFFFTI